MSGLLPSRPDVSAERDREPRVIGLDSDDASDMLTALSSETARTVLTHLHDEPATPSALAGRVDTSLQNVQYHLEKLEHAELVEQVGTQYSEKGREMTLYGPADGPLVVFPGSSEEASGFRQLLRRALAAVLFLGVVSAVIEAIAREWIPGLETGTTPAGDDAAGGGVDDGGDSETAGSDGSDGGDDSPDSADTEDASDDSASIQSQEGDDSADSSETGDEDAVSDGSTAGDESASDGDDGAALEDLDLQSEMAAQTEDPHWLVEMVVELPPGLVFFLGGCLVLLILIGVWYWRQ